MSPILSSRLAAIIVIFALVLPLVFLHETPKALAKTDNETPPPNVQAFTPEPPAPYLAPSALNAGIDQGYFSSYLYSSADRLKKMFTNTGFSDGGNLDATPLVNPTPKKTPTPTPITVQPMSTPWCDPSDPDCGTLNDPPSPDPGGPVQRTGGAEHSVQRQQFLR